MTYEEPKYEASSFTCPHCGVTAAVSWRMIIPNDGPSDIGFRQAICQNTSCHQVTLWQGNVSTTGALLIDARMIWPPHRPGPRPNPDMPKDVATSYKEAREVLPYSSRAAGGLLRLALQVLMPHVGQKGKHLNEDIANLVKIGLRPQAAKALDAVRVIGGDSVHPGQIDTDDEKTVLVMFTLLNQIVDDLITRPRESDELWDDIIPETKKEAIEERDNTG